MTLTGPEAREVAALRAFMETGRYDLAADRLGVSEGVLQNLLGRMRQRYGVKGSSIALVPALADRGLLSLVWRV